MNVQTQPSKSSLLFLLSVLLYSVGLCLIQEPSIEMLEKRGAIKREQIAYIGADGEEREYESLIEIVGFGQVLSYRDIYIATFPFLIVACVLAKIIFNSTDEIRFMIYTNCILGILLLWLTSKPNVISTILYWSGVIAASFIPNINEK